MLEPAVFPLTMMRPLILVLALLACEVVTHRPNCTKPMLGLSTWNSFALSINSSLLRDVADAMISSGLAKAGYTMVAIDDGWGAEQRNATGHIVADSTRFPEGMKALGDYFHSKGLQLGLYTARSNRTCSNQMPGSLGNEEIDAETFAYYGADYVKNDDCRVIYARAFEDYNTMEQAIIKQDRPMLHDVKAPDLTPAQATQVSQFRRVAKDLKNDWHDMVRVLDTGDDNSFLDNVGPAKGFFSDFDILEVGNHADGHGQPIMTLREWQAHFSLWAAFKSPLQIGCDIRNINASVLAIMTNADILSVNQDALGLPVRRVRSYAPASDNSTTKVYLSDCFSPDDTSAMARRQRWSVRGSVGGMQQIVQDDGRCLEVFQCSSMWPFWISVSPCANLSQAEAVRGCSAATSQQWSVHTKTQKIVSATDSCWSPSGGGRIPSSQCCIQAEGSNVEIDHCSWSLNLNRDVWVMPGDGTIRSSIDGRCMTLAGNLEVYAGDLSGGRKTAVLFNRSPEDADIVLNFEDIGWNSETKASVFDVITKKTTIATGSFKSSVAFHGVTHVVLSKL